MSMQSLIMWIKLEVLPGKITICSNWYRASISCLACVRWSTWPWQRDNTVSAPTHNSWVIRRRQHLFHLATQASGHAHTVWRTSQQTVKKNDISAVHGPLLKLFVVAVAWMARSMGCAVGLSSPPAPQVHRERLCWSRWPRVVLRLMKHLKRRLKHTFFGSELDWRQYPRRTSAKSNTPSAIVSRSRLTTYFFKARRATRSHCAQMNLLWRACKNGGGGGNFFGARTRSHRDFRLCLTHFIRVLESTSKNQIESGWKRCDSHI